MSPTTLQDYYQNLGLPEEAWHIGPEHPGLEQFALRILATLAQARTLELGVQSGGLAVPLISGAAGRPDFSYTGVDSLEYPNAVPLRLIADYLTQAGITAPARFIESDSTRVLRTASPSSYDLISELAAHDVLAGAKADWRVCEDVCRAFGYTWTIDASVLQGVAIVRRGDPPQTAIRQSLIGMRVRSRWYAHALVLRTRHAIGRVLRSIGVR